MNIKKIKIKPMIAIMLSFLIVLQVFAPITVTANQARVSGVLTEIRFQEGFTVNNDYHRVFDGRSPAWSGWKELFCLEKEVDVGDGSENTNHQFSNPNDIPRRVKLISALWKDAAVGSVTEADARIVAQAMIWVELGQIRNVNSLHRGRDGNAINYSTISNTIQRLVDAYEIAPSFTNATIDVRVGEPLTLTDTNGVLSEYADLILNTANVDVARSGNTLTITAKPNSNLSGLLFYAKDERHGSPLLLTSPTHQNVMTAGMDDPANFRININVIREGQVKLTKHDAETKDKPQGDARLIGAKYGIYSNAGATNLIDEVTIRNDLTAISKRFDIGTGRTVYVKEVQAPLGYKLDETIYPVEVNSTGNTAEIVLQNFTVRDQVIKGNVAITKLNNFTPDSAIMTPEVGAGFSIFLKSTGIQFGTEQFTNKDGFLEFKELPYGIYTVRQTTVPDGLLAVKDFEVVVNEHGKTYAYHIENNKFESLVKIVKKDIETGKTILLPNTTFKIRDLSTGEFIKQTINYPTQQVLEEFKTNEYGEFILPNKLPHGDYELVEIEAPYGYSLSKEAVKFTVDNSFQKDQLIEISFYNQAQKGKISISKTGDALVGTKPEKTQFGELLNFEFSQKPLEGVTFDVVANEDIITGDGTVRAKKGDVVDTVTTDLHGEATTKEVYLGKYRLVETKTPNGYISSEDVLVELEYADQEVMVTAERVSIKNDLQEGDIKVNKVGEFFKETDKGTLLQEFRPLKNVTFGIFVREDILVGDEIIVPANTLVDLAKTDSSGVAAFKRKFPEAQFYVRELATTSKHILGDEEFDIKIEYTNNEASNLIGIWGDGAIYGKENFAKIKREPIKNYHVPLEPKVSIKTRAHTEDGTQFFVHGDVVKMFDNVDITHENMLDGTKRAFKAILVAQLPDRTTKDIWESEIINYVVNDREFARQVMTEVNTAKYPEGTQFFFKEIGYDENGRADIKHNFDGKDKKQGIYPKAKVEPKGKPKTGDHSKAGLAIAGILFSAMLLLPLARRRKLNGAE